MPEIILMRHAAAVPAAVDASDFERDLSGPGRVEAVQAARRLAREAPSIERVLYSPAQRTRTTADIVVAELALAPDAVLAMPTLYAASRAAIRDAIAREHGGAQVLLVVGHNPGISELASELSARPRHLPTAGFWRGALAGGDWQALLRGRDRA
jgi:phosphohistidine phosphatase